MWAYALVVILSTGDEAPRVYYKHLDQCRWQAQELTRAYNNFVPIPLPFIVFVTIKSSR